MGATVPLRWTARESRMRNAMNVSRLIASLDGIGDGTVTWQALIRRFEETMTRRHENDWCGPSSTQAEGRIVMPPQGGHPEGGVSMISPWRAWSRMGSARFQRAEAGILPAPVTNASNSP